MDSVRLSKWLYIICDSRLVDHISSPSKMPCIECMPSSSIICLFCQGSRKGSSDAWDISCMDILGLVRQIRRVVDRRSYSNDHRQSHILQTLAHHFTLSDRTSTNTMNESSNKRKAGHDGRRDGGNKRNKVSLLPQSAHPTFWCSCSHIQY